MNNYFKDLLKFGFWIGVVYILLLALHNLNPEFDVYSLSPFELIMLLSILSFLRVIFSFLSNLTDSKQKSDGYLRFSKENEFITCRLEIITPPQKLLTQKTCMLNVVEESSQEKHIL